MYTNETLYIQRGEIPRIYIRYFPSLQKTLSQGLLLCVDKKSRSRAAKDPETFIREKWFATHKWRDLYVLIHDSHEQYPPSNANRSKVRQIYIPPYNVCTTCNGCLNELVEPTLRPLNGFWYNCATHHDADTCRTDIEISKNRSSIVHAYSLMSLDAFLYRPIIH